MYRVVKLGRFFAMQVDFEKDVDNIQEFVSSGDVVLLCDDLSLLEDFGISESDIEIVEPE